MTVLTSGLYAGVERSVVEGWRLDTLNALQALATGKLVQTASYSQGSSGSQSVSNMPTTEEGLRRRLLELNTVLGLGSGRRAIRVRF